MIKAMSDGQFFLNLELRETLNTVMTWRKYINKLQQEEPCTICSTVESSQITPTQSEPLCSQKNFPF